MGQSSIEAGGALRFVEVHPKDYGIKGLPPGDSEIRDGVIGCKVNGEFRRCQFLQWVIPHPSETDVPQAEIRKFMQLYQHCIDHGRLAYAQLAPVVMRKLAVQYTFDRTLITVYACSDYTREELNAWLGAPLVVEEGQLVDESVTVWPNIWRRWNDGGLRRKVWAQLLGGRPSATAEDVDKMARAVMAIESALGLIGAVERGRRQALELAAQVCAAL